MTDYLKADIQPKQATLDWLEEHTAPFEKRGIRYHRLHQMGQHQTLLPD